MRRVRNWTNALLFLLPLSILIAWAAIYVRQVWTFLFSGKRLASITSYLASRELGHDVRIGDVQIKGNLFNREAQNQLEITDLRIADNAHPETPIFQARKVLLDYNLNQFLMNDSEKTPKVDGVRVEAPQLTLNRNSTGGWNIAPLLKEILGKPSTTQRAFADRITLVGGDITYHDRQFPHPKDVPNTPFKTHWSRINGLILIRPDKSVAFRLTSGEMKDVFGGLFATGTIQPNLAQAQAQLRVSNIQLPTLAQRLAPASQLKITQGISDLSLNLTYATAKDKPKEFNPLGLQGHANLRITNADASGRWLGDPVSGLNSTLVFTPQSLEGTFKGNCIGAISEVKFGLFAFPWLAWREKRGDQTTRFQAQGVFRPVDLARLFRNPKIAQLLAQTDADTRKRLTQLRGVATVKIAAAGNLQAPVVTASAQFPRLASPEFVAQNVAFNATFKNRRMFADLRANLGKGTLFAQGDTALEAKGTYSLIAHGRNLDLAVVERMGVDKKPSKSRLEGSAQFDARATGRLGEEPNAAATIRVADLKLNDQKFRTLSADLENRGTQLLVRNFRFEDARGFAIANGEVDWKKQTLNLNLTADELDIGNIVAALPKPTEKQGSAPPTEEKENFPLEGIAYLRGDQALAAKLTGTFRRPSLAGRLTAFNVRLGTLETERLDTHFDLFKDKLILSYGNLLLTPGYVSISGIVTGLDELAKKPPSVSVNVRLEDIDLNRLMKLAGLDPKSADVSGTLSTGEISLVGTTRELRTREPFQLNLEDATIKGLPLSEAKATLSYDPKGIQITASAKAAQGELTAEGTVGVDGALQLTAGAKGIDITSALAPLTNSEELASLQGKMNARANIAGTLEKPQITMNLGAEQLQYKNYPFGTLQGNIRYQDGKTIAENLNLGDIGTMGGRLNLSQFEYDQNKKTLLGQGTWLGVSFAGTRELLSRLGEKNGMEGEEMPNTVSPLKRIATALSPLEGVTSGTIKVSGTLDNPALETLWDDIPFTLDNYPITLTKGNAIVTKDRVVIPNVVLQAQDGEISVQAPKIEYAGEMNVELNAYDVNLAFLQHWLKPSNTTSPNGEEPKGLQAWLKQQGEVAIGGKGTIAARLRGKTASPEIEQASLNLQDLTLSRKLPDNALETVFKLDRLDINDLTMLGGVLSTDFVTLRYKDLVLHAKANLKGVALAAPFLSDEARYALQARLTSKNEEDSNLQSVAELLPGLLDKASVGRFLLNVALEGTQGDPFEVVRGNASLTSERLQLKGFATGLTEVTGKLLLDNGALRVESFQGKTKVYRKNLPTALANSSSAIRFTGSLPLGFTEGQPAGANEGIHLDIDRVFFDEQPLPGATSGGARGIAKVNLAVTGSLKEPTLGGSIRFSDTLFALPGEFAATDPNAAPLPSYPQFNLQFIAENNVRLLNTLLDTKVEGTLFTTGSPTNPQLVGKLALKDGKLRLLTTRLNLLPQSEMNLRYPILVDDAPSLSLNVNILAEGNLLRAGFDGTRRRERTSLRITGPLTGAVIDPQTGESRLRITSNDPRIDSQSLLQSLLIGDISAFKQLGTSPTQVITEQLTNVFTGAILPGFFDRSAEQLGFSELSIGYDPVQNVSLNVSRQLFGPLYISYSRSLTAGQQFYSFRTSFRYRDRYQASYEIRDQNEQRFVLEGIWRF